MSTTNKDDDFKNDYFIDPACVYEGYIIAEHSMQPNTLTITNCEKFKVQLREIDIEFELDPDKLENVDVLIINGYKYVKEK